MDYPAGYMAKEENMESSRNAWRAYALELEWKLEEITKDHVKMMKGDNLERRH